jgi:hypothetical protein
MKRYVILNNVGRRVASIEATNIGYEHGMTILFGNRSIIAYIPKEMAVFEWNESYCEFETYTEKNLREVADALKKNGVIK